MYSQALLTEVRRDAADRTSRQFSMPGGARLRGTVAEGRDGEAVRKLAALSGRTPPEGTVLLAEVSGDPVAAIGIFDGKAVADPDRSGLRLRVRLRLERLFVRAAVAMRGM
jgi:hypothetical protein